MDSIIGVDLNPATLQYAAAAAAAAGLPPGRVRLLVASAEALPLADGSVDAVVGTHVRPGGCGWLCWAAVSCSRAGCCKMIRLGCSRSRLQPAAVGWFHALHGCLPRTPCFPALLHIFPWIPLQILCSVSSPAKALSEVLRVLRPGGTYTFIEHVRAPSPATRGATLQRWVRRQPAASALCMEAAFA